MSAAETYLENYRNLGHRQFPVLQESAIQHFTRLGFPTTKNEEWKYTNMGPVLSRDFSPAFEGSKLNREEILRMFPFTRDGISMVMENGILSSAASGLDALPPGIEIKKLSEVKDHPEVQKHYNRYADVMDDAFSALNTAFSNEGLVVLIHPKTVPEKPVYIIQVSSSGNDAVIAYNRLLVVAGKHSGAKISVLCVSKSGLTETFSNSVIEVFADENASLELDLLQNENEKSFHVTGAYAYQSSGSKFSVNTITLGGSILRNKLHIRLDGPDCEANMHGLYVAGGNQLVDNHTAVYHSRPHSASHEFYKGILGGKAHGVFNGKIIVEPDAQKTSAYQSNKNILLSNDAVINAKPQLEIFADDVKCTHGATTGQLDDESLFYLRSRGINENDAKAMLNLAFANDILDSVSSADLREFIASLVESKLKQVAY